MVIFKFKSEENTRWVQNYTNHRKKKEWRSINLLLENKDALITTSKAEEQMSGGVKLKYKPLVPRVKPFLLL